MSDRCSDCSHCQRNGYCDIKEDIVNPSNKACPEFEEN